jgi:hypothetical protein
MSSSTRATSLTWPEQRITELLVDRPAALLDRPDDLLDRLAEEPA